MDKECIKLCDALNRLPSVRTIESCCGHGTYNFTIYFYATDIRVINALGRLMSHNYSPYCWYKDENDEYHEDWRIKLDICDSMDFNHDILFCLEGNKDNKNLFKEADEMADYLISIWEGFCEFTLNIKSEYKSDEEYNEITKEYKVESSIRVN